LGLEKGALFLKDYGVDYLLVTKEKKIYSSNRDFVLLDESYEVI